MRIGKLLLVVTVLALIFAPSLAMATEVWDNIRNVEQERDLAVQSFKSAEQKGLFKSRGEADNIRAKLEQAKSLLKQAKIQAHRSRPKHANAKTGAAQGLIAEAYKLSTAVDESDDKVSPAPVSDGPTWIPVPSSN